MRKQIGLAAIFFLLAAAVYVLVNFRDTEKVSAISDVGSEAEDNAATSHDAEGQVKAESLSRAPSATLRSHEVPASIVSLYQATTAEALLSQAAGLSSASLDVRHQLTLASQFCGYTKRDAVVQEVPKVPGGIGRYRADAAHHDSEQFMAMLRSYCGNVDAGQLASAAEYAARTAELDGANELTQFLGSLADAEVAELASEENQKALLDVATKTESPEVFRRALDLAAIGGSAPPFVEFDRSLPAGITADRRIELRRLAAQVAFCEWTSGCGPGTLQTISSCTYFGRCSPGYSWEETLGGIYTPREVESVRNLGRVLLQSSKG